MVAVNSHFDPYRTSVLDSLGINRWEGDLRYLSRIVLEELSEGAS